MDLIREFHEQILNDLLKLPGKLDTRGVEGPYGLLVKTPARRVSYRVVTQAEFFEKVPDFPRERTGPDWFLVAVGDDIGTSLFCYPCDMVKDVLE